MLRTLLVKLKQAAAAATVAGLLVTLTVAAHAENSNPSRAALRHVSPAAITPPPPAHLPYQNSAADPSDNPRKE